jgi:hypothetical protein
MGEDFPAGRCPGFERLILVVFFSREGDVGPVGFLWVMDRELDMECEDLANG